MQESFLLFFDSTKKQNYCIKSNIVVHGEREEEKKYTKILLFHLHTLKICVYNTISVVSA